MSKPVSKKLVLPLCLEDPRAIEIVEQIPNQKRSKIIEKYIILGEMVLSHALIGTRKESVEEFFNPLKNTISTIQDQLRLIVPTISKPKKKGDMTERAIFESFQRHFLDDSFENVSTIGKYADILSTVSNAKLPILIELKDYKYTVPYKEITKFWRDMEKRGTKYGVFISMRSGMAKCSGCINIKTESDKTAIFVVNSELNWTGHLFAFHIIKKIAELEVTKKKELRGEEVEKAIYRINKNCVEIQKNMELVDNILDIADNLRTTNKRKLDELINLSQKYKLKLNDNVNDVFEEINKMNLSPEIVSMSQKFDSNSRKTEQEKVYNVAKIRQTHQRAYESWTKDEDMELKFNYQAGLTTTQLAEKHKRKRGAISSRLRKLGLE